MATSADATKLLPVLDITKAKDLQSNLLDCIKNGSVLIDGSDVERIATPCVQLILAAARDCEAAGSPFRILNISEAFKAALVDLGLQPEFNRWMN